MNKKENQCIDELLHLFVDLGNWKFLAWVGLGLKDPPVLAKIWVTKSFIIHTINIYI